MLDAAESDTNTLRVLYSYRITIMSICTMLPIFEVNAFLKANKRSVTGMTWREGLLKDDVQWWKWDCAIDLKGVVPEGSRVILQYRPEIGAASEKFNCGLLLKNERVYAIDFDQDGQHTNKVGQARPYHGKRFGPGTHEHTWSVDGYGYAEPIQDFGNLAALFAYFCKTSNLHVPGGFKQPPSQQLSLELI